MNKKVVKIAALLSAVCFMATGCGGKKADSDSGLRKIAVSELAAKDLSETMKIEGVVESTEKDSTIMTDMVNCKVSKINVSVGDTVNAGDVLCELDSSEIEKEIASLEKIINDSSTLYDYKYQQLQKELQNTKESADLDVKEASDKLEDARKDYDSKKREYDDNVSRYNSLRDETDRLAYDAANCDDPVQAEVLMQQYQIKMQEAAGAMSAYEAANAQMQALSQSISMLEKSLESVKINAKSSVDSVQYNIDTYSLSNNSSSENQKRLDELKKNLEDTKIKATKSGVVSKVIAEEGKACREGILMTVQNASNMCVHVVISEEDLLTVEKGMKAEIKNPARKDDKYSGMVDRVLDIKSGNGFDGYISIDDTTNFRIGMSAKVEIKTLDAENALAVSKKSIVTDEEDETKSYVFEAEKQSDDTYKLRKVEVTKGVESGSMVEISGAGLEEGDYIVSVPGKCSENDIVDVRVGR